MHFASCRQGCTTTACDGPCWRRRSLERKRPEADCHRLRTSSSSDLFLFFLHQLFVSRSYSVATLDIDAWRCQKGLGKGKHDGGRGIQFVALLFFLFQLPLIWSSAFASAERYWNGYGKDIGQDVVDDGNIPRIEFFSCSLYFLFWSHSVATICVDAGRYWKGYGKRNGQDADINGGRRRMLCFAHSFYFFSLLLIWSSISIWHQNQQ